MDFALGEESTCLIPGDYIDDRRRHTPMKIISRKSILYTLHSNFEDDLSKNGELEFREERGSE